MLTINTEFLGIKQGTNRSLIFLNKLVKYFKWRSSAFQSFALESLALPYLTSCPFWVGTFVLSFKVWFMYARHVLLLGLSSAVLQCENASKLVQKLRGFKVNLHCIGLSYI